MRAEFLKKFPEKHVTIQQLISSLKEKGLHYEAKFRSNNIQGCFTCIKLRGPGDKQDDIEYGLEPFNPSVPASKNEELTLLKKQIEELKKQLQQKDAQIAEFTKNQKNEAIAIKQIEDIKQPEPVDNKPKKVIIKKIYKPQGMSESKACDKVQKSQPQENPSIDDIDETVNDFFN